VTKPGASCFAMPSHTGWQWARCPAETFVTQIAIQPSSLPTLPHAPGGETSTTPKLSCHVSNFLAIVPPCILSYNLRPQTRFAPCVPSPSCRLVRRKQRNRWAIPTIYLILACFRVCLSPASTSAACRYPRVFTRLLAAMRVPGGKGSMALDPDLALDSGRA
jgi:hypothetical protein